MRSIFSIFIFLIGVATYSQEKTKPQIVEVSCGQCQFGMQSKKGCDLAVRMDGKTYFVEGTKIDQHGDAHAEDGFCNAVRKAEVVGEIKEDKFVVSYFQITTSKRIAFGSNSRKHIKNCNAYSTRASVIFIQCRNQKLQSQNHTLECWRNLQTLVFCQFGIVA